MSATPNPKRVAKALEKWFAANARELPWRETRDPYRIWVSEVMLQQTRVETVLAYYEPFIERFESVHALARASEDEVLSAWSGLGYYRRARFLHKGARYVAEHLGGELPADVEGLRAVPGVGPYTAGALASIAFDLPEPLVDGNVARVSSRLRAVEDATEQGAQAKAHWAFVAKVMREGEPRVLAQALMELGATVCKPKQPGCDRCPVARDCRALAQGLTSTIPAPKKKKASPEQHFDAVLVRWGERVLLERRPREGLLAGMWCVPLIERKTARAPKVATLGRRLPAPLDRAQDLAPVNAEPVKHVFTHRVWHLTLWQARSARRPKAPAGSQWAWISPGERPEGGVPSLTNKVLAKIGV